MMLGNFKDTVKTVFPDLWMERLMDAHEVLSSSALAFASTPASRVAGIAGQEQQDFYVKHKGGYTIPTHSKNGLGMRNHFGKLLDEYGKNELIPVCLEHDTPNFYLNRGVKSVETHSVREAEESHEESRTRTRTLWTCCLQEWVCCRCVEKHRQIELLKEEEKERTKLPLVSFDYVFSTGKCRHVPNLDSSRRRSYVLRTERFHLIPHSISCRLKNPFEGQE